MPNKTFKEVQEFLKGKIILVANRGIPARRICRSIRERFDAIAAMTATDIDKTAPSASTNSCRRSTRTTCGCCTGRAPASTTAP